MPAPDQTSFAISRAKPFSAASERNREPILDVLRATFADVGSVLEIGSGTGQHAVHFAAALPHLVWQTSDRSDNLPGLRQWLADAALPNTPEPLTLDVNDDWPAIQVDAVFSANTLHIMSWSEVQRLFAMLPRVLRADAKLTLYGPFNRAGQFTSEGNARFDADLKRADPSRGIRDIEAVARLAAQAGLEPLADIAMPANNRCVTWLRLGSMTHAPDQNR
jgi:cyclopropane fatty-acyl-phospholipid synthase-like methyltransferase